MTAPVSYLDNAATSWPKPASVADAMHGFLTDVGANPGRAGHHLANEAGRVVYRARRAVAGLLGVADPLRVVFGANATFALNLALRGLLRPGRHVVTTAMEHNSVMRPLRALEAEGVAVTVVPCSPEGVLDPAAVEAAVRPQTDLIVMTHASNVVGTILPVAEVAAVARHHGVLLLVDGAQTAGALPCSIEELGVDLFAFTGHKSLYGPMGTGGLVVGERVDVERLDPLTRGGTGSRSESDEQPGFLPDKYESGTLNVVGLAGLAAGVDWVRERGVEEIRARAVELGGILIDGLRELPGVTVYGTGNAARQMPTVSFTLTGMEPGELGRRLDDDFGIAARVGLHCSPVAHASIGTYPSGTVRFALGALSTRQDIETALRAVGHLAREVAS